MSTDEHGVVTNPDCLAGKHTACAGDAWCEDCDGRVDCGCACHQAPTDSLDPS